MRLTEQRSGYQGRRPLLNRLLSVFTLGLALVGLSGTSRAGDSILVQEQVRAVSASLVGTWTSDLGRSTIIFAVGPDGRFSLNGREGEYSVQGRTLALRTPDGETAYIFEVTTDTLTLSGADLSQPIKLLTQPMGAGVLNHVFDMTTESVILKAQRIGFIFLVVVACTLFVAVLRRVSRLVIYSEWGFLQFVYKNHKNRVMTIHSIILNLIKYLVYFTGLGFVLTELGINYTAYLASLSVVGLAVAFGSQGLVQDVVTGFFIIFESQFDVGDMVEISGQTGIVEDLGLRMTKLRNYVGEAVIIPNRNIAVVGNYGKRALQARVDVAIGDIVQAESAADLLRKVGAETAEQFQGVFLTTPFVGDPASLPSGEQFIRLSCAIWPAQQWIIDQQMIPRIRERFGINKINILGDRVAAFYYQRSNNR